MHLGSEQRSGDWRDFARETTKAGVEGLVRGGGAGRLLAERARLFDAHLSSRFDERCFALGFA